MWRGRLRGVQRNVEVWQALLSVRSLVLPRQEDVHTWLKFASLARKSGRIRYVTKVQFLHLILGIPSLIRKTRLEVSEHLQASLQNFDSSWRYLASPKVSQV